MYFLYPSLIISKNAFLGRTALFALEQFSDTVLFDYDIAKDTIRFTSNAEKLFNS
ncbi:MAG: hypothetical protein ACLS4Z_05765 [Christensenellaceae bacterium]